MTSTSTTVVANACSPTTKWNRRSPPIQELLHLHRRGHTGVDIAGRRREDTKGMKQPRRVFRSLEILRDVERTVDPNEPGCLRRARPVRHTFPEDLALFLVGGMEVLHAVDQIGNLVDSIAQLAPCTNIGVRRPDLPTLQFRNFRLMPPGPARQLRTRQSCTAAKLSQPQPQHLTLVVKCGGHASAGSRDAMAGSRSRFRLLRRKALHRPTKKATLANLFISYSGSRILGP